MADTLRLQLPLLDAAQAQKHITHNEALNRLDLLVQISVKDRDLNDAPATPSEGDTYIVGASALNDWSGHDFEVAHFRDGGWIFQAPLEGQLAFVEDEAALFVFSSGGWGAAASGGGSGLPNGGVQHQLLVKQSGANGDANWQDQVGLLGVNATPDGTNRLSTKSDALLFSHDDVTPGSGDVRVAVNKASAVGTASVLFQDGFSGRAEFGLTGDDDFHVKVSGDGSVWHDALIVRGSSGDILADKPVVLKSYSTSALPDASTVEGGVVYDGDVNAPKWSDGASWQNFASGGGGGTNVALDLGGDGDDSSALVRIQTSGDVNNIATEITADTLQFDMAQHWPVADTIVDGGVSGSAKLADNIVTNAKLAAMTAGTFKARQSGTGDPQDLSSADVRGILNIEDGATADQTGAEIKALYEAEADTNAFNDADKAKLDNVSVSSPVDLNADFQPQDARLDELVGLSLVDGDLFTVSGGGAVSRLAKGADGQILSVVSGALSWINDAGGGGGGGTVTTITQQSIVTEAALAQGTLAGTVSGATQQSII